jgi:hypothetical protein
LVTDYMVTDFLQLTAGGAAGATELDRSGIGIGVVADESGRPQELLTRDGPAPLIQVEATTPMERMIRGDVIALLNRGAPAVVVIQDARCAGILTAEAVSGYALSDFAVTAGAMADGVDVSLHGDPRSGSLTLTCATCGAVNTVAYFVAGETPCVNGHPLMVSWG